MGSYDVGFLATMIRVNMKFYIPVFIIVCCFSLLSLFVPFYPFLFFRIKEATALQARKRIDKCIIYQAFHHLYIKIN